MSRKRSHDLASPNNLDLIYKKKITDEHSWFNNIFKEFEDTEFWGNNLGDHNYCTANKIDSNNLDKKVVKETSEAIAYLDICKDTTSADEYLLCSVTNIDTFDLDIQSCVEIACHDTEDEGQSNLNIVENVSYQQVSNKQPANQQTTVQNGSFCNEATNDSGIEVSNFISIENEEESFAKKSPADIDDDDDDEAIKYINQFSMEGKLASGAEKGRSLSLPDIKRRESLSCESSRSRGVSVKRSREVCVSDESAIIPGEFEHSRRVTRLLVKNNNNTGNVRQIENTPGKLVWGYFRTGWWPAIIIRAEDAGMISTAGKIWISWIGESLISELRAKNVDSFSNKLELRLNNLSTNPKNKVTNKKQKDDACFKTIQLLKKYFTCTALVKPYTSWIKNNILPQKDKLDELLFYPYPEALLKKLNKLKEINFQKNERYLRQQEKEQLNKVTETRPSNKRVEKPEKPIEVGGINIMDQKPGMIVWAKIQGYSFWPCVIMDYQHLDRRQPHVAHQWVMWYGDYKYSQVEYRQILTFSTGVERMETKIRAMKDDIFSKAVLQASKDYCEQLGYLTDSWQLRDIINNFYKSKDKFRLKNEKPYEPNDDDLYSQTIKKQLRKQIGNYAVSEERRRHISSSKNMKSVLSRKSSLDSLCATCFESNTKELKEHPFFHASMCNKCLEEFRPKIFAYGNDNKCFYCTLCGGEDLVAMCDNMNCPRVFCTACIKYIICPDFYEEILLKHPWYCFLCDPTSISFKDSVLKIREDWRKRMISIYRLNYDYKTTANFERIHRDKKIRVLSLFDGIGTGLIVLKKLKVNVECYYASEIDPDSMQVTFFNHGHEVIQLGDVRNIDEKKIKEISPIDLLIGGSPCNELSLANPKRRGLDDPEGTGVLFYDYCRIKKLVKKYNRKDQVFWLFENVASMPKKFRTQISKNLGCEPVFIDSADFSAQHRPRLYWGNLPWGVYQANDVILQDVLRKQCNRQALVKKIMTVTTRSNSLNQSKENLKPVLMNGRKDSLWVTELEEIFGFPIHYTDANLQKTRRLQLIGKAWSVQTLTAILRPLFYF